jgi:hypothetical protein
MPLAGFESGGRRPGNNKWRLVPDCQFRNQCPGGIRTHNLGGRVSLYSKPYAARCRRTCSIAYDGTGHSLGYKTSSCTRHVFIGVVLSKHAQSLSVHVHTRRKKWLFGFRDSSRGRLTLNLLTTTVVAPPSNASKWQMGFNLVFKGLSRF